MRITAITVRMSERERQMKCPSQVEEKEVGRKRMSKERKKKKKLSRVLRPK